MMTSINNILLDIVFEENPYVETQETEVSHFLLSEKGEPIKVITPTLESMATISLGCNSNKVFTQFIKHASNYVLSILENTRLKVS